MIQLSWLLLALGGVQTTEFELDTDTPDSLCPELTMTRDAVRQRLGQLETEGGGRWHGSYSTVHDPTGRRGDYVRLVIRDAEGKEHLNRELPIKGESCDTLAQAIALVIDGFFRELTQSPTREEAEENPPPPQHPLGRVTPSERPTALPPIASTTPTPKLAGTPEQVGFALGGSYESVPSKPALTIAFSVAQPGRWRTQLQAGIPFADLREQHDVGAAVGYVIPVRWALSYALEPLVRVQWFIGPEALLSVEHGAAKGVPNVHTGWRVSPGIGAQTGLAYWVTRSVGLAASVSGDEVFFQSRGFLMYQQPVLEFSRTRLSATFGIWAVIWP